MLKEQIEAALSLLTPRQRLVAQRQFKAYAEGSCPTTEEVVSQLQKEGFVITLEDLSTT